MARLEESLTAKLRPTMVEELTATLTPAITARVQEEMMRVFGSSLASIGVTQPTHPPMDVPPPSAARVSTKGSCAKPNTADQELPATNQEVVVADTDHSGMCG